MELILLIIIEILIATNLILGLTIYYKDQAYCKEVREHEITKSKLIKELER